MTGYGFAQFGADNDRHKIHHGKHMVGKLCAGHIRHGLTGERQIKPLKKGHFFILRATNGPGGADGYVQLAGLSVRKRIF